MHKLDYTLEPLFPPAELAHETEAELVASLERTWRKQNGVKPARKKSLTNHYREGLAECGEALF